MKKVFFYALIAVALSSYPDGVKASQERPNELKTYRLVLPGSSWGVEIRVSPQFSSNKKLESESFLELRDGKTDFGITAELEKATSEGDSKALREYYAKKENLRLKADIKQYEVGDAAIKEIVIKDPLFRTTSGEVVVSKFLNYYLSYRGYWAVIRILKPFYKRSDKKTFDDIVKYIRIVATEPPPSSPSGKIPLGKLWTSSLKTDPPIM
ncbi:MAG: hypothetical protein ABFD52_07175 [Acidobacteriota bacterium]